MVYFSVHVPKDREFSGEILPCPENRNLYSERLCPAAFRGCLPEFSVDEVTAIISGLFRKQWRKALSGTVQRIAVTIGRRRYSATTIFPLTLPFSSCSCACGISPKAYIRSIWTFKFPFSSIAAICRMPSPSECTSMCL